MYIYIFCPIYHLNSSKAFLALKTFKFLPWVLYINFVFYKYSNRLQRKLLHTYKGPIGALKNHSGVCAI